MGFLLDVLMQRRTAVFAVFFAAVASASYEVIGVKMMALVGIVTTAAYFSDLLTKLIYNNLPRRLIEDCNDKAVLVTGCDSGFGNALALRLDALGFKVYAGCLQMSSPGAQELKANCSNRLHLVPLDVTQQDQVDSAVQFVTTTIDNRKLWAVVNNAGVGCSSEIEWCPMTIYQQMLDVNTLGPVRVTKAFLPLLREAEGRVVVVASVAGRVTVPGFTPYSMSKFAAVAFTDGLRREMKKFNVSVHSVEPSLYKTGISSLEPMYNSLKKYWEQCPDDVLTSYGSEYLEEFKHSLKLHMERGKPVDKISEVVDDILDAVAGAEPKVRYLPAMDAQFRFRVLYGMPLPMQDYVLDQYSPKTPPAAVAARRSIPSLKNPYGKSQRPMYQRYMSVPVREKNLPETLQEEDEPSAFKF